MQEVSLRDFLRNYKSLSPVPDEGIHVICRDMEDFYIYKHPVNPPPSNTEKLRAIAEFLAAELQRINWEPVERPLAAKPAQTAPSSLPKPVTAAAPVKFCEAKLILPWESPCKIEGSEHVAVASLKEGEPMGPEDWKEFYLCPTHRKVIEQLGDYEIEDA